MTTTATAPAVGSPSRASGHTLRPDIEGLRAVAVGTVVAYHAGVPGFRGGFIGVDIFFVISGFLITSLLLREVERSGRISLTTFYARRARRLLPAASLVLLVTAVAGWFLLPLTTRGDLGTDVVTATFYVINWGLASRSVDYLAEDSAPSVLQHYWSLSVEEQFYVVWPAIILLGIVLAARYGLKRRRVNGWMLTAVAVASLAWSVHLTSADPARAYFVSTTRLWELAVGALLAFGVVRAAALSQRARELLAAGGLLAIALAAVVYTSSTPWPGYHALLPTLGCALVIAGGVGAPTAAGRLLSWGPFVWIGGLSYAIYLWHWPVLELTQQAFGDQRLLVRIALGLSAIGLAWLTKHLVEDPIRFAGPLVRSNALSLALAAALMVATAGVGWVVRASLPVIGERSVQGAAALIADPSSDEWTVRSDPAAVYTDSGPVEPPASVATEDVPTYYDDDCQITAGDDRVNPECTYGVPDGDTTVALLGDSKAGQWFSAVDRIAKRENWRLDLYLKSACSFTTKGEKEPTCNRFGQNVLRTLEDPSRTPDVAIVSAGNRPEAALDAGMREAVDRLKALGTTVVLLQDNPKPRSQTVYRCVAENATYERCAYRVDASSGKALTALAKATDSPLVDLTRWMCPDTSQRCPAVVGGSLLLRQGSHLTSTYVDTLTPMLHRELSRLGVARTPVPEITVANP